MSYRRYDNRYPKKGKSSYLRKHLRQDVVTATGVFKEEIINVPIDTSLYKGIIIREINVQIGAPVATKYQSIQVTTESKAAEAQINDSKVIFKHRSIGGTAVNGNTEQTVSKEMKPPQPVYTDKIYVGCIQDSGGAITYYFDIIYDEKIFDKDDLMGLMQQFAI